MMKVMLAALLFLSLSILPAFGQAQHTFMGHHLGETYTQAMAVIKATGGTSVTEAGKCITSSADSNVDQPNECAGDANLSDAISVESDNRPTAFVTFDFVGDKLIRVTASGCGSGISQVLLLEKKFGKYSRVTDMPFRNTTGSLAWNKEWDWKTPRNEHLYVLEGFDSTCGGTDDAVVFEKPAKARVVNPY